MKLFIWYGENNSMFCLFQGGMCFAIAETIDEARKQIHMEYEETYGDSGPANIESELSRKPDYERPISRSMGVFCWEES